MKHLRALLLPLVFTSLSAANLAAEEALPDGEALLIKDAGETNLNEFVWKKRPVIVFADSEDDPAFIAQMEFFEDRPEPMRERDVIVLTDTNGDELSALRKKLRPRGFMIVILSKEGRVQLRKPFPWSVREISRSIDKLPIRQREIRDAKAAGG